MDNRIKLKRVGDVKIFEIFGEFKGSFARRGKAAILQALKTWESPHLLINIQEVKEIDQEGIDVLKETAAHFEKRALLAHSSTVVEAIEKQNGGRFFRVLKGRDEAARFFSHEFARIPAGDVLDEGRGFIRLKTALPLHFSYSHADLSKTYNFFAVVTNLSEAGLFAEFIESISESSAARHLNPLDLQLLNLRLYFSQKVSVEVDGKIIHGKIEEGGIGIEFYNMSRQGRQLLNDWIAKHLIEQAEGLKKASDEEGVSHGKK